MQPEKYLYPERFKWYLVKTDKGFKRTFAKSKEQAIKQAIKKGYIVDNINLLKGGLTMKRNRTLFFMQVADSEDTLIERGEKILYDLSKLPSVNVKVNNLRKLFFGKDHQWRVDFYVVKDSRITWDKVYETVNQTKAPYYKFI